MNRTLLAFAAALSVAGPVTADPPTASLSSEERSRLRFVANQLEVLQECRRQEQALLAAAGATALEPKESAGLEQYRKMRLLEIRTLLATAKRWPKTVETEDRKRVLSVLKAEKRWLAAAPSAALESDRSCWLEARRAPLLKRKQSAWLELQKLSQ